MNKNGTTYTKNIILIFTCLLSCVFFFTSTYSKAQQLPIFVNVNKSKLVFGKDSSDFMKFYKKMDELKSGKRNRVTVAHFGGSHIQAGFWPEALINGFQATGNYEGGGLFVFPFKIVKSNTPCFYKSFGYGKFKRCRCAISREMCDNMGMSGMAAITNDSLVTFGFKLLETSHPKNFNSVKVYHNFNPSFELGLNHESSLKFARKDEVKKGYSEFTFETFIDSLNFVVTKKDSINKDFMLNGFSVENSNPGFYYASMGVNGASSGSFLRCPEFVKELKSIPPDMVVFTLGVNDTHDTNFSKAAFMAKHDSLIGEIKKASPNCTFLFVTTTDNYLNRKTPNRRPIKAQEAAYELMEKHGGAVYDLYAVMGGYKSIYKWQKAGLAARDKVHFNSRGYRLFAGLMYDAIDRSYKYNSKVKEIK
jgi:lysophospholipase L1-like esterase